VILLTGIPAYRAYHQFTPTLAEGAFQAVFFRDYEPKIAGVDDYWCRPGPRGCVRAARSARFEHGTGGVRPSNRDSPGP
jgi:hypothetical protein